MSVKSSRRRSSNRQPGPPGLPDENWSIMAQPSAVSDYAARRQQTGLSGLDTKQDAANQAGHSL